MLALSNGVLNVLPPEAGTPDSGPGDILLGVSAADGVAGETRLYSEAVWSRPPTSASCSTAACVTAPAT